MPCPNKNLPEWKALHNAVGEFEAYKVYATYNHDIPRIFANPYLSSTDMQVISRFLTHQQDKADSLYLRHRLPVLEKISHEPEQKTQISTLLKAMNGDTAVPVPSIADMENRVITEKKIQILSKILPVTVVHDNSLNAYAQIDPYKAGEIPTLRVNLSHGVASDTIIHEFGHIFIDAMGGMSNPMIQQGRRHLTGSTVEADVLTHGEYKDLDKETLDKEILARAIGIEGAAIYSARTGTLMERFQGWLTLFLNKLRKVLGINYNVAQELARRMLNNEVNKDNVVSIGSLVAQKQAFPASMTPEQETTYKNIINKAQATTLSEKGEYYTVEGIEGKFQRTSNRITEVYPESLFPEDKREAYEYARQWGNMNDMIWDGVINGDTLSIIKQNIAQRKKTDKLMARYNLTEDVFNTIYNYAKNYVQEKTRMGYVVLSQQGIYSIGTQVAGTTDVLLIDANGQIIIVDNKSSTNPTSEPYAKGKWSYSDRGKFESYRTKHTKQLSAYQKMYEDMGFSVAGLIIQPVYWGSVTDTEVRGATIEPEIHLQYNKQFAHKIIDNTQKKSREVLAQNPELEVKLDTLSKRIYERVNVLLSEFKKGNNDEAWYNQMLVLSAQLARGSNLSSILEFTKQGIERTKAVLKDMEDIQSGANVSDKSLLNLKTYVNTFNIAEDMLKTVAEIREELASIPEKTPMDIFTLRFLSVNNIQLSKLKSQVDAANNLYLATAKKRLIPMLAGVSRWGEGVFRETQLKEWKENNKRPSSESISKWEQRGVDFVNELVANSMPVIHNMNIKHIKETLDAAPRDINTFEMWISDVKGVNDNILQLTDTTLRQAEFQAMTGFYEKRDMYEPVYKAFLEAKKGVATTNYKELYKEIYEINPETGEPTGYLVGKYLSAFIDAEKAFFQNYRSKGKRPTRKEKDDFYQKAWDKYRNPQWDAMEERRAKVESGEIKSDPILDMYDHILYGFDTINNIYPKAQSLQIKFFDHYNPEENTREFVYSYKLPSIEKSNIERLRDQGIFKTLSEGAKDLTKEDTMTTEYGHLEIDPQTGKQIYKEASVKGALGMEAFAKIKLDVQNRPSLKIPTPFRAELEDKNQQSYDLMSVLMIDMTQAYNYREKELIVPQIEMLRDVLHERKVTQTTNGNALYNWVKGGLPFQITPKESAVNSFKLFQSIVEDRLYGITKKHVGNITIFGKTVSADKLSNLIAGWTSDTFLALNYIASPVAALQGTVMNAMEAMAGHHLSNTDLAKANAFYMANLPGSMIDTGARIPTHKMGLIMERFNVMSHFHGIEARYGQGRFTNLFNKGTLHGMQNMQEHYVQGTLALAQLYKTKVADNVGNMHPLIDAYEFTEGKMELKPEFSNTVTKDIEYRVSSQIREIAKQLHGNYDTHNKAMIQRYVLGTYTFMFRKWLVPGVQKRYRGIGQVRQRVLKGEKNYDKAFFSEALGEFDEGMYTDTAVFIGNIFKNWRFLHAKLAVAEVEKLTPQERANIKRTLFEVGMMIASFAASAFLAGLAKDNPDDDEKARLYALALYAQRLYSELSFYRSLDQAFLILRTPAASISMVKKIFDLLGQLGHDVTTGEFEKYQKGPHKGDTKAGKRFRDIVPIVNQIDRRYEDMYRYIAR